MRLLYRYLLKYNMEKEHKTRTYLLLFSILCSTTLFAGSVMAVNNLIDTYDSYITRQYGGFNVKVSGEKEIREEIQNDKIAHSIHMRVGQGKINDSSVTLVGTASEKIAEYQLCQFVEKLENTNALEDGYCFLSIRTASRLHLNTGDSITIQAGTKQIPLIVAGLASSEFVFAGDDSNQIAVMLNENSFCESFGEEASMEMQYLMVEDEDLDSWILDFNSQHENLTAAKTYDREEAELQINLIRSPLYFMVAIVVVCAIFLVMSTYKLIILDRLSVFGTFLSQGLSRGKLLLGLFVESILFGGIGGIAGGIMGNLLCLMINNYSNPLAMYHIKAANTFHINGVFAGCIFAMILVVVSAFLPILSVRKQSLKAILTQTLETKEQTSSKWGIAGIVVLLGTMILHFQSDSHGEFSALSLLGLFLGGVLIVPLIAQVQVKLLQILPRKNYGVGVLLSNQLSSSKLVLNDMRVLTILLTIIIMLVSVSDEMASLVGDGYKVINFDSYVSVPKEQAGDIHQIIEKEDFLVNESADFTAYLDGNSKKAVNLIAMNPEEYLKFENYIGFENKEQQLEELRNQENGIIISSQTAKNNQLKEGDSVRLITKDGFDQELVVTSICNAKMWRGGNYNLITLDTARKCFGIQYPTAYYITTSMDTKEEVNYLKMLLKDYDGKVYSKKELVETEEKNLKQIAAMMNVFSLAVIFLGLIAMGSNIFISNYYKKKEICLLRVLGMEERDNGYLQVVSNIHKTMISFLNVFVLSMLAIMYTRDFMKFLSFDMELKYPVQKALMTAGIVLAGQIIIGLLSSLGEKKGNIRELLKQM